MLQKCSDCIFLTHLSAFMCAVLAQAFSWSSLLQERASVELERSGERWDKWESMVTYTSLYIHAVLHHAWRAENLPTVQRKKSSQTALLHLVSHISKILVCPGIHFTAKHRPYSLQIEWVASKWNEVEQAGALIKNLSGSCISPTDFAKNIWEDVIIAFLSV